MKKKNKTDERTTTIANRLEHCISRVCRGGVAYIHSKLRAFTHTLARTLYKGRKKKCPGLVFLLLHSFFPSLHIFCYAMPRTLYETFPWKSCKKKMGKWWGMNGILFAMRNRYGYMVNWCEDERDRHGRKSQGMKKFNWRLLLLARKTTKSLAIWPSLANLLQEHGNILEL